MNDNEPRILTDDDRMRLNGNDSDYDRHFLPRPEEREDKSTNDKE